MPRAPRLDLPNVPMHVTQRGVNRCAIFVDDDDRHHYRRLLHKACNTCNVAIHAYVLMDNHVHLLLTATECGAISRVMRGSGHAYVQAFNARHGRCGTLFQGRFKSSPVDSERYLLNVIRYIELNPVRAAMVETADAWRWSSIHTHVGRARDPLITLHPLYLGMGASTSERADAYQRWLRDGIDEDELAAIRRSLAQERVLGDAGFERMVARTLDRPAACRQPGRPRQL